MKRSPQRGPVRTSTTRDTSAPSRSSRGGSTRAVR